MPPPESVPMPPAQVRHPLLKGRQQVAALWFPSAWFGEAARVRRIVEAWRAGAQAFRFAEGDLLRFAQPLSLDCDHATGWPLRREGSDGSGGQALCSAELTPGERAALPPADIWLVDGGEVLALRLAQAAPIDPSHWLAAGPPLFDTFDCREALPEPEVLDTEGRTLREVLGDAVPPASPAQAEFLEKLRERANRQGASKQQARPGTPSGASRPGGHCGRGGAPVMRWVVGVAVFLWAARALFHQLGAPQGASTASQVDAGSLLLSLIVFAIAVLVFWWLRRFRAPAASRRAGRGEAVPAPARPAASPSLKQRATARPARARWRDWVARLAITSRLSRLLGRQQAAYLNRMLKMFDDGDLDRALRHAIPLGGGMQSLGQAFGTPGPRNDLSLSGSLAQGPSIHLGNDFEAHLRQLYRKAFEKLDREGRIDEAVFVLAELLQARQEALDYLEKHQRHAQAAELALSWDWPPATIVRLLCLAGDWRRALAVARRDDAFANAVLQLRERWPDAANRLRREWGEALAQQGEWLKAVDAVWPAASLREQAAEWLLAAEVAGGQLAARALVQRALLLPDTLQDCAQRLEALRDDASLHGERAALAAALNAATGHTAASRGLLAVLLPALLADQSQGLGRLDRKALQSLLRLQADPLLQADLPGSALPVVDDVPLAEQPQVLALDAPEAGAHEVFDAVPLDEDRYLVAIGEAGALMTNSTGRVLARFAVPAYRLVAGHSGQVALALAKRDGLWRVSRIDLVQRQVSDLGLGEFDHFAGEFDGIGWTVTRSNRIQVLDTGRSLRDVLWQVADLPGDVIEMSVTRSVEQFVVDDRAWGDGSASAPSLWRYHCPQRQLRQREPIERPLAEISKRMLHPQIGAFHLMADDGADDLLRVSWKLGPHAGGEFHVPGAGARTLQVKSDLDWLVTSEATAQGRLVRWLALRGGRRAASLSWPAPDVRVRAVADGGWLLFDDEGRLLHLDTARSRVVSFSVR